MKRVKYCITYCPEDSTLKWVVNRIGLNGRLTELSRLSSPDAAVLFGEAVVIVSRDLSPRIRRVVRDGGLKLEGIKDIDKLIELAQGVVSIKQAHLFGPCIFEAEDGNLYEVVPTVVVQRIPEGDTTDRESPPWEID